MDHGVPGDDVAAGHGGEKAKGEGEAAIGEVAGEHGVPGNGGAAGHPIEKRSGRDACAR